jgi:hypothetical protein
MPPDVNDPIRSYIRANREKYTEEAIRDQLLAAGHDRAAIDEAWGLEVDPAGKVPGATARKVRTGWAIVIYVYGVLALLYSAVTGFTQVGSSGRIFVLLFLVIFAVAGYFAVRWIARWRPLTGFGQLLVAIFVVPLIFGLVAFGSCVVALPGLAIQ